MLPDGKLKIIRYQDIVGEFSACQDCNRDTRGQAMRCENADGFRMAAGNVATIFVNDVSDSHWPPAISFDKDIYNLYHGPRIDQERACRIICTISIT